MTKQFNNVDATGNAVMIGNEFVRVNIARTIVIIDKSWFNKTQALQLRDWLNNVLAEDAKAVSAIDQAYWDSQVESRLEQPVHEHDCTECVFLGSFISVKSETYDMYIHPSGDRTLIARYGTLGEYISCPLAYVEGYKPGTAIYEAYQRAKARGLVYEKG